MIGLINMGNVCCSGFDGGGSEEIQEVCGQKLALGQGLEERKYIYIQSECEFVEKNKVGLVIRSLARNYLNRKYLLVCRRFLEYRIECRVLFAPFPNVSEIQMVEDRIPLFRKFGEEIGSFPYFLPAQLPDGRIYEGQWDLSTKSPSGFGTILYLDRSKYTGFLKNGKKSGQGRLIKPNGEFYEGQFEDDIIEGLGKLTKANGLIYEGSFKYGKEHGEGKLEYEGEVLYKGEFFQGAKHGKGILKIGGGSYCGEFIDNCMEGEGVYIWDDGKRYEGGWKKNMIHGEGKYSWPDGREYNGCYSFGNRDGYGIFKWPDGRVYSGEWYKGNMHGIGTYTCTNKNGAEQTIKAIWENGKKKKLITK